MTRHLIDDYGHTTADDTRARAIEATENVMYDMRLPGFSAIWPIAAAVVDAVTPIIRADDRRPFRECMEIAACAILPRLKDDDGTEYVAVEALNAEIRAQAARVARGDA